MHFSQYSGSFSTPYCLPLAFGQPSLLFASARLHQAHPKDAPHFAFTVPAMNRGAPAAWYEWTVLPQGMKNSSTLCQLFADLKRTLQSKGLVIAPEKVQREPLWKYLRWVITQSHVCSQKLTLHTDIQTLNDAQKLLGDLQWLRPIVGLSNNDLNSLRPLLKGTNPAARVSVSPEQRQTIEHLAQTVVERSVDRRDPSLPIDITMLLG